MEFILASHIKTGISLEIKTMTPLQKNAMQCQKLTGNSRMIYCNRL